MIACSRCHTSYEDDGTRFCGRCGAALERPQVASASWIGRLVGGRYRVLAILGEGSTGTVYKVEHAAIGKLAAIKVIHPLLSADREVVKQFRREARAISLLSHPNTVQVFDLSEEHGQLFIVMELVHGESLGQIIRRDGPLPWARASSLLCQVCEALGAAHAARIIHRDLKPENILVTRDRAGNDVVKVLDFGLAKLYHPTEPEEAPGPSTERGSLLGTPFYMSPEQIRGEHLDPRADIYSFGALAYRLITGEQAFDAPTPLAVLSRHLNELAVPPSARCPHLAIPPAADAVIIRCLAKAKEDRFATFEDVHSAIQAMGAPERVDRRQAPRGEHRGDRRGADAQGRQALSRGEIDEFERALRRGRRRRLALLPLAGLLAGLVAALALRGEAPLVEEREPNDVAERANLIAVGRPVRGTIGKGAPGPADRDYYRFRIDRAAPRLRASLEGAVSQTLRVDLFTPRGELLGSTSGSSARSLDAQRALPAGEYFLEVREVRPPSEPTGEATPEPYTLRAEIPSH